MSIDPSGLELIKSFEGCRLSSYLCPAKVWTIGYGHTGPDVYEGQTITQGQADALLYSDLNRVSLAVRAICSTTTAAQHASLVSLAYNIGIDHFRRSSVARLHNTGDVAAAARAFALWTKATDASGVKRDLRGLVRRRAAESALYLSDDGQMDSQRTRAVDVAPEKPLTESRVMIGSVVGGAATLGTGLSEIVSNIESMKAMLLPLMPYMPLLQNLFVVLGLLGIAAAMYGRWQDRQSGKL